MSALLLSTVSAQKKYENPVYGYDFPDPSVERADDGYFYAYATGLKVTRSKDLMTWSDVDDVISRPTWNDTTYVGTDGKKKTDTFDFWACDVSKTLDGSFLMHYACAYWGDYARTGIGVAKGATASKFTDAGKMFRSSEIGVESSIDPCYVEEFDKKYLVWGSYHDIYIAELTDDGTQVKSFSKKTKLCGDGFEAVMIYKRGKYYYMFCSVGSCCQGEKSTYKTVVGRSTSLTGTYVNKNGGKMLNNNYTTVISGNDYWKGPGHNSEIITDDEGQTWLLYHCYDMSTNCSNGRLLMLDKITWDANGWPVVNDGHPSSGKQDGPIFYTGNGANITYKVRNADMSKSRFAGWTVTASDDCTYASGKGTAFMPVGTVKGGTFDISQTVSTSISDGLYEMKVNGFDSGHSVEYYVGKVGTPAYNPADDGKAVVSSETTISNNIINRDYYVQSVYGLVVGGKLTFGMRSKQALEEKEHFHVSNVRLIYRDKAESADSTALASVMKSYYDMYEDYKASGKPYYAGYNASMDLCTGAAKESDSKSTRYSQLLKMHEIIDSIQTSIDTYAMLQTETKALEDKVAVATEGGYVTQEAQEALAEAQQVLADCNMCNEDVSTLLNRMQTAARIMVCQYQQGDGSKDNPYVIMRPEQMDYMHEVLVKNQMVYFVLGADVDMQGISWEQLNSSANSSAYQINFDGQGHVIRNLTPAGEKYYPSFFGTMCGEIRNVGFVDAKVEATASGAAIIGGTLGHSSYKDADGNLLPVIIENCYVTGTVTSKGYVGAIGGTLGNSPVYIRNCYSAADIVGNGSSINYSGGLIGRVRTDLTLENCYAAGAVASPIAGGVVAGGQNSSTPASVYKNVIAWNPSVDGTTALPFGGTAALDLLNEIYTFSDMTVNDAPNEEGLSHQELLNVARKWGAPWYQDPSAGNGYPILQWQYDRGDYVELCGFDPNSPVSVTAPQGTPEADDVIFNLSGQRLDKVRKGINIIDGRKVLR